MPAPTTSLKTLLQRHQRRIGLVLLALLLLAGSLPFMPELWRSRQDADQQLQAIPSRNQGYDDVGERLSLRFRDSVGERPSPGQRRMQLQRRRGTYDSLLAICFGVAGLALLILMRPVWRWWKRAYARWVAAVAEAKDGSA